MRAVIPIADADDERLAPYTSIRERDLVGRDRRFIVEGEVVLRMAVAQRRFALESVLLAESRVARVAPLLASLPEATPVFAVSAEVMRRVAGFPVHRGVLAIGLRGAEPSAAELLARCDPAALAVGLVGLTNHDNVGGVFRNAAAFGVAAVVLDPATCDPLYRKAIRVSVGASLVVPFARAASPDEMIAELLRAGFDVVALTPRGQAPIEDVRWSARTALLVGAEGAGLPEPVLSRSRTVRIAMAPGFDSLNVATACGIALHRASAAGRDAAAAAEPDGGPARRLTR